MADDRPGDQGRFDALALAKALPDGGDTMLVDRYMTDGETASTRVFRVFRPTPPHHHNKSDEYLYVLSGRGTFWMGEASAVSEFAPGHLLVFRRGTVHALPTITDHPVLFLAIDAPRRDPQDVIFENPQDGTPGEFIQQVSKA